MWLFDQCPGDHRAVLEHVLQIQKAAVMGVLDEVITVMEMDDPLIMRLHHILRQQDPSCDIPADFPGNVITLGGIDNRILIGVLLLGLLVVPLDQ